MRQQPTTGHWHAEVGNGALREFKPRATATGGAYEVALPACPVSLRLAAPRFADAALEMDGDADSRNVWMRPLPSAIGGSLTLQGPAELPVLVADATGRWFRVVAGNATVEVPTDTLIQIASFGARAGLWFPKLDTPPMRRGEKRTVKLHTLPAVRLGVDVTPARDGTLAITPASYKEMKRPLRVPLVDGKAEVWVRPGRQVQVDVHATGNFFPVSFEITADREDFRWPVRLRASAGLRYRLRDAAGNPVPFARGRVWEPGRSGRLDLRRKPKVTFADAGGVVEFTGLRGGEAAFEIVARGFRTKLFSSLRLTEGTMLDADALVLEPAGHFEGRITDYAGKPVVGAWVRVLEPAVVRLPMPGGGERDVYDLVHHDTGTGATGTDGTFRVFDAAARAPLLACFPTARPDLTRVAFPPGDATQLTGLARISLDAPSSISGVYQLLDGGQAVLIAIDPPMSLRPLPITVPAGKVNLFVRLRNRRWAAATVNLKRGEHLRLSPDWH